MGESDVVISKLYECMRNRCDDAALRIVTDSVVETNVRRWSDIYMCDNNMVVTLLLSYDEELKMGCKHIKYSLGSS